MLNYSYNRVDLIIKSFYKEKTKKFLCFSLFYGFINGISLGFELIVQKRRFEEFIVRHVFLD